MELHPVIMEAVTTIGIALLGLVAAYGTHAIQTATKKIKLQTQQLESDHQRKLFDNALSDLELYATKAVASIEQTTASTLRAAVKDGKVSRDELLDLADVAVDKVVNSLTNDSLDILERNIDNLEDYLRDCIEAKVRELKLASPPTPLKEPNYDV